MTLEKFFEENKKVAIALSGGIDSIFLMHMAKKSGADVRAYFAKSEFQPDFELRDAKIAAEKAGVSLRIAELSALENFEIAKNGKDRCYFCKKQMMNAIKKAAEEDGFFLVCDGTNASDDIDDRAGWRAICELSVRSPLRECGITKAEIRTRAREEGISVWDKLSYACLATRIKCDEEITKEKLLKVSESEEFLSKLGFVDFRVRISGNCAKLELRRADAEKFSRERENILQELGRYFDEIEEDWEARDEKLTD